MRVIIFGATGYIGSAVARCFLEHGHTVSGWARNADNQTLLRAKGIEPIQTQLDDVEQLTETLAPFDVVVMAASVRFEDEAQIVRNMVAACGRQDKHFLLTSGTGVLGIEAKAGQWDENTFAEDDPFPFPARSLRSFRLPIEDFVRASTGEGLNTYVIRPPLIYGNNGSIQIPQIFESVRRTGSACYLGHGLNLYSSVHIDDLAEIYRLAVEKGAPGAVYHAVSGEANFRSIAEAVAVVCGCETKSLSYAEACDLWGAFWVDLALAVNSRSIARRTRADLGWTPRHLDVIEDIRNGSYLDGYRKAQETGGAAYVYASHK